MCVLMCVTISMTDTMPCPQIQCSICSFDVHGVSIGLCVCIVHDVCASYAKINIAHSTRTCTRLSVAIIRPSALHCLSPPLVEAHR